MTRNNEGAHQLQQDSYEEGMAHPGAEGYDGNQMNAIGARKPGGRPSIQDIYGKRSGFQRPAGSFNKISPSINGAPKSYHTLRIR